MVCAGGYYLVTIYDSVMSGYAPLIVALSETVVITYVYGRSDGNYFIQKFRFILVISNMIEKCMFVFCCLIVR